MSKKDNNNTFEIDNTRKNSNLTNAKTQKTMSFIHNIVILKKK